MPQTIMSQTIVEQAALLLGMKTSEITDVVEREDYAVITTHDGVRTVVDAEGRLRPYDAELHGLDDVLVTEPGPEPVGLPDGTVVEPGTGPNPDLDAVPEGTVEIVLAWVGADVDRANRALEAEQAAGKPRSSLVDQLQKLVAQ